MGSLESDQVSMFGMNQNLGLKPEEDEADVHNEETFGDDTDSSELNFIAEPWSQNTDEDINDSGVKPDMSLNEKDEIKSETRVKSGSDEARRTSEGDSILDTDFSTLRLNAGGDYDEDDVTPTIGRSSRANPWSLPQFNDDTSVSDYEVPSQYRRSNSCVSQISTPSRSFSSEVNSSQNPYSVMPDEDQRIKLGMANRQRLSHTSANFFSSSMQPERRASIACSQKLEREKYSQPRNQYRFNSSTDNFDRRNVDTFGLNSVQEHLSAATRPNDPNDVQGLVSGSSYDNFDSNFYGPCSSNGQVSSNGNGQNGIVIHNGDKLRDPRCQELYQQYIKTAKSRSHVQGDNFTPQMAAQLDPNYSVYMQSPDEQLSRGASSSKEFNLRALDENRSQEVNSFIQQSKECRLLSYMLEDILEKLYDFGDKITEEEAVNFVLGLVENTMPERVNLMVCLLQGRRVLMRVIHALWKFQQRIPALDIMCTMFAQLNHLLLMDRDDMIFAYKLRVFDIVISECTLMELCRLAHALLTATRDAVQSKLGVTLIGRLADRAGDIDAINYPEWTRDIMPRLLDHIKFVKSTIIHRLIGSRAFRHIQECIVVMQKSQHYANVHNYHK